MVHGPNEDTSISTNEQLWIVQIVIPSVVNAKVLIAQIEDYLSL